jgi:predicted ribosome-associated RNA-binding protein Tma20
VSVSRHSCSIGVSRLSQFIFLLIGTRFISNRREKNKGIGIELAHYLGDGLFQAAEL